MCGCVFQLDISFSLVVSISAPDEEKIMISIGIMDQGLLLTGRSSKIHQWNHQTNVYRSSFLTRILLNHFEQRIAPKHEFGFSFLHSVLSASHFAHEYLNYFVYFLMNRCVKKCTGVWKMNFETYFYKKILNASHTSSTYRQKSFLLVLLILEAWHEFLKRRFHKKNENIEIVWQNCD